MWCSTCQQDAPALGSASEGTLHCGKCGGALASEAKPVLAGRYATSAAGSTAASETPTLEKLLRSSPLSNEDWAIEAELRGVQRLLSSLKTRSSELADALQPPPSHLRPPASKQTYIGREAAHESHHPQKNRQPSGHLAAWTTLSVSLA